MSLLPSQKFILIALLIIGGIGAYYYSQNSNFVQLPEGIQLTTTQHITQQLSEKLPTDISDQVSSIAQQSEHLSQQAGAVLGTAVEKNEDASIPQQAAEYARYLYCQQVVETYEASNITKTE